jgi:hypothetical protein
MSRPPRRFCSTLSPLCVPLCIACAIASLGATARANMRAPRSVERSPSSALYAAGAHLVVLREDLSFRCTRSACRAQAVYHVQAAAPARQTLEFISPDANRLLVEVNTLRPLQVSSVPLDRDERARVAAGMGLRGREGAKLHKARFEAVLRRGLNTIRVRYRQRLSSQERDHGYVSDGRFVHLLQYELWPLKGWRLAKGFTLNLSVKLRRGAPSWWARNFGRYTNIACGKRGQGRAFALHRQQRGGYLVLSARLGANFPDRLICSIGDDDLV